ncbi:MAG: transposase [Proteobacteria bacterium]|nr:transposase [Pseudomonadota bacterium]
MEDYNAFVGLDVHKDSISVAIADAGRDDEIRMYGTIANTHDAVSRLMRKLVQRHGKIEVTYEAGPCGYGNYRQLAEMGIVCRIVAPSHTPKRPGERVKHDTRDALMLARLLRAGELTFVWVSVPQDATISSMVKAGIVFGTVESRRRTPDGTAKKSDGAHRPWPIMKRKNVRSTVTVMRTEDRERSSP